MEGRILRDNMPAYRCNEFPYSQVAYMCAENVFCYTFVWVDIVHGNTVLKWTVEKNSGRKELIWFYGKFDVDIDVSKAIHMLTNKICDLPFDWKFYFNDDFFESED